MKRLARVAVLLSLSIGASGGLETLAYGASNPIAVSSNEAQQEEIEEPVTRLQIAEIIYDFYVTQRL